MFLLTVNDSPFDPTLFLINYFISGSDFREGITVSKGDILELDGSKGEANFIIKWSNSKSQSYMKIVDSKGVTGEYTAADSGKVKTIFVLECRGNTHCYSD